MTKNDASRKLVILPIYNESATLEGVLEELRPVADILLLVNDGSADSSGEISGKWAKEHENVWFIDLKENMGKSEALRIGFEKILEIAGEGKVDENDLVILTDADGQIPPDIIQESCESFIKKGTDILIGSRDFSLYPSIKKMGNAILSKIASVLSGHDFIDTQCGYRIFSVGALRKILPFYKAHRYACEQEISIIAGLLDLKIDNSYIINTAYYRSNSTFYDAFHISLDSLATWWRVKTASKSLAERYNKKYT